MCSYSLILFFITNYRRYCFFLQNNRRIPEDVSMETKDDTISPPDPSLIDDPVISDYNVPSESEEDSIVDRHLQ